MIYEAHTATVYTNSGDSYSTSGIILPGHLTKREFTSELLQTGWNQTQIATYLFRWEDRNKVAQGDRLLIDGEYWNCITKVMARNEVYILREARIMLEKTEG